MSRLFHVPDTLDAPVTAKQAVQARVNVEGEEAFTALTASSNVHQVPRLLRNGSEVVRVLGRICAWTCVFRRVCMCGRVDVCVCVWTCVFVRVTCLDVCLDVCGIVLRRFIKLSMAAEHTTVAMPSVAWSDRRGGGG